MKNLILGWLVLSIFSLSLHCDVSGYDWLANTLEAKSNIEAKQEAANGSAHQKGNHQHVTLNQHNTKNHLHLGNKNCHTNDINQIDCHSVSSTICADIDWLAVSFNNNSLASSFSPDWQALESPFKEDINYSRFQKTASFTYTSKPYHYALPTVYKITQRFRI